MQKAHTIETTNKYTITSLGKQDTFVYDIETEDNHNFFANGILVHNSVYLSLDRLVQRYMETKDETEICNFLCKCEPILQEVIDDALNEVAETFNCPKPCMKMAREVIATSGVWTGKKRYAVHVMDDGGVRKNELKVKVTGLELKRSTTPEAIKPFLENIIELILSGEESELQDYVKHVKREFMKLPLEKLGIVKGVSKVDSYLLPDGSMKKGTPMQSRAALVYNRMLKEKGLDSEYYPIKGGDKIKILYLRMPNPTGENVIAFSNSLPHELDLHSFVDKEMMWTKSFIAATEILTKALGWDVEAVEGFDV